MKKILLPLLLLTFSINAQITNGLVAEYLFNGNINDSYGTYNGTGTPNYTTDRFGGNTALNASTSSVIDIPQNLLNGPSRSISLWIKGFNKEGGIMGHQNSSSSSTPTTYVPIIYVRADGQLNIRYWTTINGTSNTNITQFNYNNDNLWHHVVITGDGGEQRAYIDNRLVGISDGIDDIGGLPFNQIGYAYMGGQWPSKPQNKYDGIIDDVRIYNQKISSTVVSELYNEGNYKAPYSKNIIYVDANASGNNDGTSWINAYNEATDAFINVNDGDDIWMAQGTYYPGTNRNATFSWSKDSVSVYGGFDGTETSLSQRNWMTNPTILSGDIGILGDSTDNSYIVFTGPKGSNSSKNIISYALIDGLHITGGTANNNVIPTDNPDGSGIRLNPYVSKVTFNNINIYNNTGNIGAAFSYYSSNIPTRIELNNTEIYNNHAGGAPAFYIGGEGSNTASVYLTGVLIHNNEVTSSASFGQGKGLYGYASTKNQASIGLVLINCTSTDNINTTADTNIAGIEVSTSSLGNNNLSVFNSILYNNPGTKEIGKDGNRSFNSIRFRNAILDGTIDSPNSPMLSNVTNFNPQFNNPTLKDYSLSASSPAINAGASSGLSHLYPTNDIAGNPRVSGTEIDLGVFEYYSPNSVRGLKNSILKIYPNPSSNIIYLSGINNLENYKTSVYTMNGKLLMETENKKQINISKLTKGTYLIKVELDTKVSTHLIIKN